LAAALLIAALPVLALVALLIWLDDGRPIFFHQHRAGKDGRVFRIHKFRTLATEATGTTQPAHHATRVGAGLRRWGLDELPQLWNVIRGDMSLVGPRPVLPEEARGYDARAAQRLSVRPGLTGWAQVNGRNELDWAERVELDLWYVRHRTVGLDLRILLKTPGVLLSGTGVYGPGNHDPDAQDVDARLHHLRS
jgi:lipopolysaccharide/colanic/teichoic acid biosynthesis glycosyltransferase